MLGSLIGRLLPVIIHLDNKTPRRTAMKKLTAELTLLATRRDARLIFFVLTVALYILAAGAPDAAGGVGM